MGRCVEFFEEAHGLKREKLVYKEGIWGNMSGLKLDYRFGKGNVVLIGDAAGLMDIMGEGIPTAIKSGILCAETINGLNLENSSELRDKYHENLKKLLKRLKSNLNATRSMYGHLW